VAENCLVVAKPIVVTDAGGGAAPLPLPVRTKPKSTHVSGYVVDGAGHPQPIFQDAKVKRKNGRPKVVFTLNELGRQKVRDLAAGQTLQVEFLVGYDGSTTLDTYTAQLGRKAGKKRAR
jgi:hypothetical protein